MAMCAADTRTGCCVCEPPSDVTMWTLTTGPGSYTACCCGGAHVACRCELNRERLWCHERRCAARPGVTVPADRGVEYCRYDVAGWQRVDVYMVHMHVS